MPALEIRLSDCVVWELPETSTGVEVLRPQIEPCNDLRDTVQKALTAPLEYVPFDHTVVAGDRLVLVADLSLPEIDRLLSELAKWFVERGTTASNIKIVLAGVPGYAATTVQQQLESAIERITGCAIEVEIHDVDDPSKVVYVGADEEAAPIYLNRTMMDADVLIPVLTARPRSGVDNFGPFSLFPLVSTRKTRGEFYGLQRAGSTKKLERQMTRRVEKSAAAAWWGGVFLAIQVVPAPGHRIGRVLAGTLEATSRAAEQCMAECWSIQAQRGDLVIATLESPVHQQDWVALARALHVADRCTMDGGTVVLCSQAEPRAGNACQTLREGRLRNEDVSDLLAAGTDDDTLAIELFDRILADKQLYVAWQESAELLSGLGATPLQSAEELTQLIESSSRTLVIPGAPNWDVITKVSVNDA